MSDDIELLLGDNPFFGIDHLSQERARERIQVLQGFHKITEIMELSTKMGINGFVVSTHPQLRDLLTHMKSNTSLLDRMFFYPILPYVQGYVTRVTEKGAIGAMNDILSGNSLQKKLKVFFNGSVGFMKKDFNKVLETFIDVELLSLNEARKEVIFLHDIITDLAIGLGLKNVIETFMHHVKDKYGIKTGLVTKNFPKLVESLTDWNLNIPTIMTSFNSIGYQMNPSRTECEQYLSKADEVIAMNVLAGGFLNPKESAEYISKLKIKKVVIGMSKEEHVKETIMTFREL